ncbi:MAG: cupredoxin domain-containing protein [Ilumatobacter sp.]
MKFRNTAVAVTTVAFIAVGCSSDAEDTAPDDATTNEATDEEAAAEPDAPAAGASIEIEGFAFSSLGAVAPGTEISVVNIDTAAHTLSASDGAFDTGNIAGEATSTVTAPSEPGTYDFVCNIHPSMTGTLTVEG